MRYRADVDGLRAVAIVAVLLFHGFPEVLPGGFVGVDVFFAISGYLIAGVILKGLEAGRFTFRGFYANRARRILPALVLVVAAVLGFGWFTLLPDEFARVGKQAAASMVFVQNFVLWKEAGYFDTVSISKPLLHLWSLSIEEQFYLLFPFIVWSAWRTGRNVRALLVVLALVSLGYNLNGITSHPVRTFYLPHPRVWELLAGAILALGMPPKLGSLRASLNHGVLQPRRGRKFLTLDLREGAFADMSSALGLIMILWAMFAFDGRDAYPGWRAIFPVLGACLVIAAGPGGWCNRVILANRLAAFVGLISYPLYLWHWPILSFLHIIGGAAPSSIVRAAAIAVSFVLAWLTYRLVEIPVRFGKKTLPGMAALATMTIVVGCFGYGAFVREGIPSRRVVQLNPRLDSTPAGRVIEPSYVTAGCGPGGNTLTEAFTWCVHDTRGPVRFAPFGDSKAAALSWGLFTESDDGGRWLFVGAPFFSPVVSDAGLYAQYQERAHLGVDSLVKNDDIKVVVITTATRILFHLYGAFTIEDLPSSPNQEIAFAGLDGMIGALVAGGKKVVITVDNPTLADPRFCISRVTAIPAANWLAGLDKQRAGCSIGLDRHLELSRQYRTVLDRLARKYPNHLRVFDTIGLLCESERRLCSSSSGGKFLYSYDDHISNYAATIIGKELVPFVEHFAAEPAIPSDRL